MNTILSLIIVLLVGLNTYMIYMREQVETCHFAKGMKQMRDSMYFYDPMQGKLLQLDSYKPGDRQIKACDAIGETI